MTASDSDGETGSVTDNARPELPPKELTDRLDSVEKGDRLLVNGRETPFEVVATDRYSVTVTDPDGHRHTLSQNLQSGGWNIHEEIRWVGSLDRDE